MVAYDADSWCMIHLTPNSAVVRVTANIADEEMALQLAKANRRRGGHVFGCVSAGTLVAALHLVQNMQQDWRVGVKVKPKYRPDPTGVGWRDGMLRAIHGQTGTVVRVLPAGELVIELPSGHTLIEPADNWMTAEQQPTGTDS